MMGLVSRFWGVLGVGSGRCDAYESEIRYLLRLPVRPDLKWLGGGHHGWRTKNDKASSLNRRYISPGNTERQGQEVCGGRTGCL